MKDLLENLNEIPGVEGSMVLTSDGIMVAAALGSHLDEDVVAALSSSLTITLKRSLEPFAGRIPEELVLTASEGKLVFIRLASAYLVIVTKRALQLESGMVEIRSIAQKLRQRCEMSV